MAVKKITSTVVKNAVSDIKRYTIRDSEIQGLVLRVEPSGKKTYYLDYRTSKDGKRSSYKIGDATVLTPAQAREIAKEKLADVIRGIPLVEEKKLEELTIEDVFQKYKSFVVAHHKTTNAIGFIERDFKYLFSTKCSDLTLIDIERWTSEEKTRKRGSSINRALAAFRAMLNWALSRDIITECPVMKKKIKMVAETDSRHVIRYLSEDERTRLLGALNQREDRMGKKDFLRTAVLVSLNTGIRRGALFALRWNDLNWDTQIITLRATTAKNQKTCYIPMNSIVYRTLREWKEFQKPTSDEFLIFPNPVTGKMMHDCRSSWEKVLRDADVKNFRWHDMRHDFASQLVMADVNVLTVMELMTHSKLDMTLRYAHLAPKRKKDAVNTLSVLYK